MIKDDMIQNDYSRLDNMILEYFKDKPGPSPSVKFNHAAKRSIDILLGSVGLIVSAPLIAAFGIATIYDSGNPMFFKQERLGYRGEHITVYKIRTMHNGTEEKMMNGEIEFKDVYNNQHASPVYTNLGRILDYTHLNELPQLWNVVKGEMSIVGNRPISLYHIRLFSCVQGYLDRFDSKPGLIGYSQLRFRPFDVCEAVRMDSEYSQVYNAGNVLAEDWKIFRLAIKTYYDIFKFKKFRNVCDTA
ncbi:MAG: sugar transferase [Candidatus Woesearchaeota archaeon]